MARATKKSAKKSTARGAAPRDTKTALAARAAKAVTDAISKSKKGGRKDDMDVHVHVGDVVMMGFDEAVDAEEWGMRETNNEGAARGGSRGRGKAARDTDGQDEKGRKVRRSITLRKGPLALQAVERSEPAKKRAAKKKSAKKKAAAKKPTSIQKKKTAKKKSKKR